MPVYSIILPIYKQADHVKQLFKNYANTLSKLEDSYEVHFVVNGPDDGAYEILQKLATDKPNYHIHKITQKGWGAAVAFGLKIASGDFICYTNSARTQMSDLLLMLKYAKVNDKTVVKATRISRDSLVRKIGSLLYNLEVRFLFHVAVFDVNGTPKVLPKRVVKELNLVSTGDTIDAEIIARCGKLEIPVIEIPVKITTRLGGASTTNFVSAYKMYKGVAELKKVI